MNGPDGARPTLLLTPPPPDGEPPAMVAGPAPMTAGPAAPALRLTLPPADAPVDHVMVVPGPAQAVTAGARAQAVDVALPRLENERAYRIVREVAQAHSGSAGYSAVVVPPADDPAGVGLRFGILLFGQRSGHLGSVLRLTHGRDADLLARILGPAAADVLATTTAADPGSRLDPVDGAPLWAGRWTALLQQLGAEPACQAAQNEEAIEALFRPAERIAVALGLDTERALAVAFDVVVEMGLEAGLDRITEVCGPLRTEAQRRHALASLGHADLAAFQAGTSWTPPDGRFNLQTHAALVAALRERGDVPLPDADDLVDRLVRYATDDAARSRLTALRGSTSFAGVRHARD